MDFRDYAAKETSASVRRAVTRSGEASRRQFDAVRVALDAAAKALASTPAAEDERDAADLAARLTKAAASAAEQAAKHVADEAQKASDALRAELQAAIKQTMVVAASLKEAQAQSETLRGELKTATERGEAVSRQLGDARKTNEKLEATRAELTASRDALRAEAAGATKKLEKMAADNMAVAASLKEAQAQSETLRGELKAATERGEGASRQLGEARKTNEKLEATRAELTASRDALRAEAAVAAKKLEKTAADNTALEESSSAAHSQAQASEAKLAAVTDLFKQSAARVKALERAQQDHEQAIRDLESRPRHAPAAVVTAAAPLSLLDDVLAAFEALGSATTISDVLRTLMEQLGAQFPRVALFRVKKNHLQGEHQIGFDLKTDIAKVVMPLGMDSLLARAASSGQIERLSGAELKNRTPAPFSGTPGSALAVPVMVNGEPLAIVYADDAGRGEGNSKTAGYDVNARFAQALQTHAAALVARLTNELRALAELQAYAGSLLREIQQMHAADLQAGLSDRDVPTRLKANLEYARSIYGSRIALEGTDAAALLEDQLAALLEAQRGTPFGRDLSEAAGRPDLAAPQAAEAS